MLAGSIDANCRGDRKRGMSWLVDEYNQCSTTSTLSFSRIDVLNDQKLDMTMSLTLSVSFSWLISFYFIYIYICPKTKSFIATYPIGIPVSFNVLSIASYIHAKPSNILLMAVTWNAIITASKRVYIYTIKLIDSGQLNLFLPFPNKFYQKFLYKYLYILKFRLYRKKFFSLCIATIMGEPRRRSFYTQWTLTTTNICVLCLVWTNIWRL